MNFFRGKLLVAALLAAAFVLPVSVAASVEPDVDFNANVGSKFGNGGGYFVAKQTDGKILVGGAFVGYNSSSLNRLVRLNEDGTDDASFNANLGTGFNGNVQAVLVLSSGKILVGGSFGTFNGVTRNRLVLLNEDGTEDTDFAANLGAGFTGSGVFSLREQDDGKILVAGAFTALDGDARSNIVRLSADGTEDAAFAGNVPASNSFIRDMEVQSSGKIVIAGNFTSFGSGSTHYVARLNEDGTEDTDFAANTGTGFNGFVFRTSQDSSGNLFFGGNFTSFNGTAVGYVAKLSVDGVLDAAFAANTGTGSNDDLLSVAVATSTGKVLLGGNSSMATFDGNVAARIARVANDGTFDDDFGAAMGTGFNGQMQYVYPYGNQIYAAGTFTTFDGGSSVRLMKFVATVVPDTTAPSVSVSAPTDGSTVSGVIAFSAVASDDTDVSEVRFFVNGIQESSEDTSNPYGITWDTTLVADGSYTLAAAARDAAGNYATSTVSVTVSNAVVEEEEEEEEPRRSRPPQRRGVVSPARSDSAGDGSTGAGEDVSSSEACIPVDVRAAPPAADRDLQFGDRDEDVRDLQRFLNEDGFPLEVAGPGSPGLETPIFGTLTRAALARWQAAHCVTPAAGYYGPITRAAMSVRAE